MPSDEKIFKITKLVAYFRMKPLPAKTGLVEDTLRHLQAKADATDVLIREIEEVLALS